MFAHHAIDGFLLRAILRGGARILFGERFLLGAHACHHFSLRLGDRLLVLDARRIEHALGLIAHLLRLVARLLRHRGFLACRLANQLFGGAADFQRGLRFAFGFLARFAFGVDAGLELGLRPAFGPFAGCCDFGGFLLVRLALGLDAGFHLGAGAALGVFARGAHRGFMRLALFLDPGFSFGARLALGLQFLAGFFTRYGA